MIPFLVQVYLTGRDLIEFNYYRQFNNIPEMIALCSGKCRNHTAKSVLFGKYWFRNPITRWLWETFRAWKSFTWNFFVWSNRTCRSSKLWRWETWTMQKLWYIVHHRAYTIARKYYDYTADKTKDWEPEEKTLWTCKKYWFYQTWSQKTLTLSGLVVVDGTFTQLHKNENKFCFLWNEANTNTNNHCAEKVTSAYVNLLLKSEECLKRFTFKYGLVQFFSKWKFLGFSFII